MGDIRWPRGAQAQQHWTKHMNKIRTHNESEKHNMRENAMGFSFTAQKTHIIIFLTVNQHNEKTKTTISLKTCH